jgi:hypothetical protein
MAIADNTITDTELKRALTEIDILLKRRQARWETPRNLAIIIGVAVALFGTLSAIVGFQLGSRPPQQISVHLDQPLQVQIGPSR